MPCGERRLVRKVLYRDASGPRGLHLGFAVGEEQKRRFGGATGRWFRGARRVVPARTTVDSLRPCRRGRRSSQSPFWPYLRQRLRTLWAALPGGWTGRTRCATGKWRAMTVFVPRCRRGLQGFAAHRMTTRRTIHLTPCPRSFPRPLGSGPGWWCPQSSWLQACTASFPSRDGSCAGDAAAPWREASAPLAPVAHCDSRAEACVVRKRPDIGRFRTSN